MSGELDLVTAPHLESALHRFVNDGQHILLDLADVAFLDCGGWRAVDNAAKAAVGRGCHLILKDTSEAVDRFLEVIGPTAIPSDGAGLPSADGYRL